MDAAEFYTGIVVDAYSKLKSTSFDPKPYADFVGAAGEPGLEIGCGDGEPLLSLRQAGLEVDGVDSSADMLERCRANAAATGVEVTLYHQRMEDLSLPRRYRSIYLAGPTFNLLPDDETARRALAAIRQHLTPDGQAMIPLWIPGPTPEAELGRQREAVDDEGATLVYTPLSETYDPVLRTRVTTVRYERRSPDGAVESADRDWVLHWHTQTSAREMCVDVGLDVVRIEGDAGGAATADDFTLAVQPKSFF
ncbi:methyltransferase family protein [Kribbella voronezhensis]|uniref:Methyltransferase family protein n=1 Tax=Kribbella voronezhensis TaxID=2512212 RepID=A0A4R7T6U7_9ACTN|nr:class I SAM-dependent methyltransferase [Kribbella voronezhensis]TDU87551.1 methyltransferase family protein [Kribbella voronezhensis]